MRTVAPCIKKSLQAAVKATEQFTDPAKQDLAARSILMSEYLGEVQTVDLEQNPEALERARDLLENLVQTHGTPSKNALIRKLTKNNPRLTLLWGAVNDNGELADFYRLGRQQWAGRVINTPKESLISTYYRQLGGVSLDNVVERLNHQPEQQWAADKTLEQLLADDDIFYNEGLFYPATALCQGRNGYDLITEFESQALTLDPENADEKPLLDKFSQQIALLRSQMKYRPLEGIPVNLHAFTKTGWLRLEILNKCPAIVEMGQLHPLPRGKVGMKAVEAYLGSLEVESLVNYLNRDKLSASDAEDYEARSHEGVNSAKRKEYIGNLSEEVRDWLLTSEFRQEVEWEFNRRFNGFITKNYSDEPFPLARLTPPPGLTPHPYQYKDVRQLNDMGKGILAWGTGVGKTLGALMLILYRQERGLCRTAMIVTPKSLIANWKREIDCWCPSVRYLVIGLTQKFWADGTPAREVEGYQVVTEDGSPKRVNDRYVLKAGKITIEMTPAEFDRRAELQFSEDSPEEKLAKWQQATVNTYDILLCWRETFKSLPLDPAIELRYLDDLVGRHLPSDENDNYFGDAKDKVSIADRRKELLESIEVGQAAEAEGSLDPDAVLADMEAESAEHDEGDYKEQEIKAKKRAVMNERRGQKLSSKLITFDQILGPGGMLVMDEAHAFRNLFSPQGDHAETKGAQINPSQRAYDLYMKAHYILECNNSTNVYLLTATPVANSAIDLCALLMLFADEELRERGVEVIDDFISIFGKVAEITAPTMSGSIQTASTLYGFQLLDELRSLALKYTIRRDGRNVNFKQPQERPITHVVPMTAEQNYLYSLLIARMEYGLALMAEGPKGWAEFKTSPELFPFSVLADMDKLSLDPQNYLQSSKYGEKLDALWTIAESAGRNSYTLNNPLNNYNFRLSETLQTLAEQTTEARGFPLYHSTRKRRYGEIESEDPDFSDPFYEIFQELKESKAQFKAVGSLGDYTEQQYGERLEQGCLRSIMDVVYKLSIIEGDTSLYRQWEWVDGYPFHSIEMWHLIRDIVVADREERRLQGALRIIEDNIMGAKNDLKLSEDQRQQELVRLKEKRKAAIKDLADGTAAALKARQDCQVQPGDTRLHRERVHVLTADYDWERQDGLPMYDDSSPKFDRLTAEAVMYYHAGCLDFEDLETGKAIKTTPHGLFTLDGEEEKPDLDAALAHWSTLAVGQEHTVWVDGKRCRARLVKISGGNQLIFADQVGNDTGDRDSVRVYRNIKQRLVDAGIPAREIELIYGAVKPQKRQAIAQRYTTGDIRVTILNTATGGEGLNFFGGVYFTAAIHHLTLPWHGAAIKQRNGRGIRQGNEMDWVDTHQYLSPGTVDQFRFFVVKRKSGGDESLWAEGVDELINETGIPTFDEMCAALSNDPIEAKRRIEEARVKEEARKRIQKQERALSRFFQFFNQLCVVMHNRKYREWKPGMPEYQSATKVLRELAVTLSRSEDFAYTHCLDWEKYLKANDLPFLVTKTRQVFEVDDYVKDQWDRIYRIKQISGITGHVKLLGVLGVKDPIPSSVPSRDKTDRSAIANQAIEDGRLTVKCFAPTDKEWSQRRSEGVVTYDKRHHHRALWNWANVRFDHYRKTHAEILLERIELVTSYGLLSKLLTPEEIKEHRPAILKNLLLHEPALFCWVTDEGDSVQRLGTALVTELTDVDDIALPTDDGFVDQLSVFFFLNRGNPGFHHGHPWRLIRETLHGMDIREDTLKDRGLELAEDRYPTMAETEAAIERYFEAHPDSLYLNVEELMQLLGYGRGLEKDAFYRALRAKEYDVKYITGAYRGSYNQSSSEPGVTTSGYYIKRSMPAIVPEVDAPGV